MNSDGKDRGGCKHHMVMCSVGDPQKPVSVDQSVATRHEEEPFEEMSWHCRQVL